MEPDQPLTSTPLQPLLDLLDRGRYVRLVARPGLLAGDRAEGSDHVGAPWSAEQHGAALEWVERGGVLRGGCTATVLDDALVVCRPPDALRHVEDLSRDGWLSTLAARTLSGALGLGRNILVVGPWAVAVELIAALVADGQRPGILGEAQDAIPPGWARLPDLRAVSRLGVDRVGVWSLEASRLAPAMARLSGVAGWIDARRLDRALVRYEAGMEAAVGRPCTPLHVLAGLDLIVVASDFGGPRVREISEIALVPEGYRPRALFVTGLPPAPTALVPVGLPSFVDELAQAGHVVLADELRYATMGRAPEVPRPAPRAVEPAPPVEISRPSPGGGRAIPKARPRKVSVAERVATIEPPSDTAWGQSLGDDAAAPGWELDQLGDEAFGEQGGSGSYEEAAMAASFGLGPPPRPGTQKGVAADTATFSDAMHRARDREQTAVSNDPDGSADPES